MPKENGILIFAGKIVGLELVRFLIQQSYPIKKIIVASKLDLELYEMAKSIDIEVNYYNKELQQQIIDNEERFEWILSLWNPHILKAGLLNLSSHRLNIHPSLLPHGGGNDNAMWTIRNEMKAGVSLIEMEGGIDEGAIYDQVTIDYTFPTTGKQLNEKLREDSISFFKKSWPLIYLGNIIPRKMDLRSYYTRAQTNEDRVKIADEKIEIKEFIIWALAHDFYPNTTAEVSLNQVRYSVQVTIKKLN